ncbi:hypothetical protein JTE90_029131 [Oedothorax gibbosus]|uniref:Uncharacterized protein n=1 Tax=Oedothorax gibbosus TaxID=931172 RepID=A0AAV6TJZ3_9ARAC|nr:hypothetical protein JTE90_029131 [Oedothorax gibbosus]
MIAGRPGGGRILQVSPYQLSMLGYAPPNMVVTGDGESGLIPEESLRKTGYPHPGRAAGRQITHSRNGEVVDEKKRRDSLSPVIGMKYTLKPLAIINWRASKVPAAALTLAPIAGGRNESKGHGGGSGPHSGIPVSLAGGAHRENRRVPLWKWRSLSAHVGPKRWELCPDRTRQRKTLVESVAFDVQNRSSRSGSSGVRQSKLELVPSGSFLRIAGAH